MSLMFEMSIQSETLAHDELSHITGCVRRCDQIGWLDMHGWIYFKTRGGDPIVGRLYARMKLSGISHNQLGALGYREPDLSKVR